MPSDYRNLTYGGAAVDSSSSTGSDSDIQALKKDHEEFVVFRTEVFQDISVSGCLCLDTSTFDLRHSLRAR